MYFKHINLQLVSVQLRKLRTKKGFDWDEDDSKVYSVCGCTTFILGSKSCSLQINMGDDGSKNWSYFTRPSTIEDQITYLWVSAPMRSVQGDLYALLRFHGGFVCLCFEKGAVTSCGKYASFCGYFSFRSRHSFRQFFHSFMFLHYFT